VSQIVQRLESKLGTQLFERTSRRVAMSQAGRRLREELAPAYSDLAHVLSRAYADNGAVTGVLRLGVYSTAGGPRLIDIVRLFEARHPECEVHISDMAWEDTLGPLQPLSACHSPRATVPRRGQGIEGKKSGETATVGGRPRSPRDERPWCRTGVLHGGRSRAQRSRTSMAYGWSPTRWTFTFAGFARRLAFGARLTAPAARPPSLPWPRSAAKRTRRAAHCALRGEARGRSALLWRRGSADARVAAFARYAGALSSDSQSTTQAAVR
jgi:DNA-binding transcriptional LysR family regulator